MEFNHVLPLLSPLVTLAILGGLRLLSDSFNRKLDASSENIIRRVSSMEEKLDYLAVAVGDLKKEQFQAMREIAHIKGSLRLPLDAGRVEEGIG